MTNFRKETWIYTKRGKVRLLAVSDPLLGASGPQEPWGQAYWPAAAGDFWAPPAAGEGRTACARRRAFSLVLK
jgi:hypothetical protein